jgi:hypothetical protein
VGGDDDAACEPAVHGVLVRHEVRGRRQKITDQADATDLSRSILDGFVGH